MIKKIKMDLPQEDWKSKLEADDNAFLLDVRTLQEFEAGHITNASLLDIYQSREFIEGIKSFDPSKNYYVYCRSGVRSGQACKLMNQIGISKTYNLLGGFMEWVGESSKTI